MNCSGKTEHQLSGQMGEILSGRYFFALAHCKNALFLVVGKRRDSFPDFYCKNSGLLGVGRCNERAFVFLEEVFL